MKVFITGGSGFVGRDVIKQLLAFGHSLRALVRTTDTLKSFSTIETAIGDTTKPETLRDQLSGCDAVIHLVGIIREFPGKGITFDKLHSESTEYMLRASKEQGIKRFIQMSANGTRTNAATRYHQSKWAAEEQVRQSGLDWTIFRPSLIFGPQDQFINMLAKLIKTLPIVPVMGDGKYRLQPVSVSDIAQSFVAALDKPETVGHTYQCCGPEIFNYDELLDLIAKVLGRTSGARKIHQPLCLMKPVVSVLQKIPLFPMTSDQLIMLLEGNVCENTRWRDDFNLELTDLKSGISRYLK